MSRCGSDGSASDYESPRTLETFLAVFPCLAPWGALSLLSNWVPECPWYSWAPWEVKGGRAWDWPPTSLRTVGQENVELYLHISHAPFTARAYRTGDSFTFTLLKNIIKW